MKNKDNNLYMVHILGAQPIYIKNISNARIKAHGVHQHSGTEVYIHKTKFDQYGQLVSNGVIEIYKK